MKENSVAERVFKLREALGLSQKQLGKRINVFPQNISAWENGTRNPGLKSCRKLIKLASEYDIHIDDNFLRPDLA